LFICKGTVTRNHFEIALDGKDYADEICGFFAKLGAVDLGLAPKTSIRKNRAVVYFKEGGQISAVLGIMGAVSSMLEYENIRIEKGIYNDINRRVNFLQANMDKTLSASVIQRESILLIERKMGLASLPRGLEETARLRLEHPEISLKELGAKLSRPVGKSGAGHRLKRLIEIADTLNSEG
jgi:hypothetical protein